MTTEVRQKLETWSQAARNAVNGFEVQKSAPDEEKKSIGALPFQPDCIKTLLKTHSQGLKSLKDLLPVKVPKDKDARAGRKRGAEKDGQQAAPKRRTSKSAP